MASSDLLPHCGVCNETLKYGGSEPYLLPCLHSTCSDCLNKTSKTLSCSHCGDTFSKQDYIFLKDPITKSEILHSTLKNKPTEITCTNKPHKNVAIIWCKDCQVFYCKSCEVAHCQVKTSQDHDVVSLKNLAPSATLGTQSKCPEHDSYLVDLYDRTCEILICSKCARTDHKQCQNEDLRIAGNEDKAMLLAEQNMLAFKLQDVVSNLESINQKQKESEARMERMKKALSHKFGNLRSLIDQRESELMKILDQKHNSINDDIKKANCRFEKSAEKIQAANEYAKKLLARDSPEEFLMLKNNVKSRVERCFNEDVNPVEIAEVIVYFSKETLGELKTLICSYGDFTSFDGAECTSPEGEEPKSESLYVNNAVDIGHAKSTDNVQGVVNSESYVNIEDLSENTGDSYSHTGSSEQQEHVYSDGISIGASCPKLTFDLERVNTGKVHISNDGFLINSKLPSGKMLVSYGGTTSTKPLPKNELVYWEVETDIAIAEQIQTYGLLMEIGVVEDENKDRPYCVSGQSGSSSLSIAHCSNHKGICAKIWNNGTKIRCEEDVLLKKAGKSYTLKHGVLCDGKTGAVIFFDLTKMKQIEIVKGSAEVNAGDLWPIFGVFSPILASVKMRLVAGVDILLSDDKLSLLEKGRRELVS